MRKIGRGWQYTVYDLGNDRVLKRYNSRTIGYAHLALDNFPFTEHAIWQIPSLYRTCQDDAYRSLQKISHLDIASWKLGNPEFSNALDYEQDKLTPIGNLLTEAQDSLQGEVIVDSFVEFVRFLLDHSGLVDKGFNISKNFGSNSEGRIVLMDLGELYSGDAARAQIRSRAWAAPYVVQALPEQYRIYFINSMDRAFLY